MRRGNQVLMGTYDVSTTERLFNVTKGVVSQLLGRPTIGRPISLSRATWPDDWRKSDGKHCRRHVRKRSKTMLSGFSSCIRSMKSSGGDSWDLVSSREPARTFARRWRDRDVRFSLGDIRKTHIQGRRQSMVLGSIRTAECSCSRAPTAATGKSASRFILGRMRRKPDVRRWTSPASGKVFRQAPRWCAINENGRCAASAAGIFADPQNASARFPSSRSPSARCSKAWGCRCRRSISPDIVQLTTLLKWS